MQVTLRTRLALLLCTCLLLTLGSGPQPPGAGAQEPFATYLPLVVRPDILVSSVLTPFDANVRDLAGPSSWETNYGKSPEIIAASSGADLHVLAQDYDPNTPWSAALLHIAPTAAGYKVTGAHTGLPMLDRVMGLAVDAAGNRYYATGVDEEDIVSPTYPPLNTPRSNIVRVVKLSPAGEILFNTDLDIARRALDGGAELIINPMVAATSRLAVGGGEVALIHGNNTDPDAAIGGQRHQKALSTRLDASSGAVTRPSSVWVSHSFDQRLLYDGQGITEQHLGDAFPRSIVFGREHSPHPLFQIKGGVGENNTRTRLGNMALIENDPAYRYIALFATESSAATGDTINGARNLAIVRVSGSDSSIDPSLPDALTVFSAGSTHTNRLRWLTSYSAASGTHAERPKLVALGENRYIVLWEEWREAGGFSGSFNGVYGMVIDAGGNTIRPATLLTKGHHLHRGDDAFLLGGRAGWVTGDAAGRRLHLHLVDASLGYEVVTLE